MVKKRNISYLRETVSVRPEHLPRNLRTHSDLDLLEILISNPDLCLDCDDDLARERATRLLDGGDAAVLRRLTSRRLSQQLGTVTAMRLLAALELGQRALKGQGSRVLSSPKHVFEYARSYATAEKEHFLAVHLSTRHVPELLEVVSIGTLNASLVHPREVFRRAIKEGSANLILVHNHPSGDPAPSADDVEITTRLIRVGELVGIEVLDHVILAGERYFSFREEGFVEN
jgi:DNA repair protein RadC